MYKKGVYANTFSNFFDSKMKSIILLKGPGVYPTILSFFVFFDKIDRIILKCKFYPSITSITQNLRLIEKCSLRFVTLKDIKLLTKDLENKKAADVNSSLNSKFL